MPKPLYEGLNIGIRRNDTAQRTNNSAAVHNTVDVAPRILRAEDHVGSGSSRKRGKNVSHNLVISIKPKIALMNRRCSDGVRYDDGITGGGGGGAAPPGAAERA